MKHRTRIYFSAAQRADIWNRWQRGESMSSIGRLFERQSSSIYPILSRSGGIRPPTRTRAQVALSLSEREEISRGVASQQSMRCMARRLKRAPSPRSVVKSIAMGGMMAIEPRWQTKPLGSERTAPNSASWLGIVP